MKTIDVKEQPPLGISRTFSLTVIGIRYRMFRSSVTVAVVVVAIAFLMNILSESLIKRSLVAETKGRVIELRQAAVWAARLSNPGTLKEIILGVASANENDPIRQEALTMGDITAEEMPSFVARCRKAADYQGFFSDLEYGRRRRLVHTSTDCDIFDRLSDPEEFKRFASELGGMKSVRFVSSLEDFREFLGEWPELKRRTEAVRASRATAVAKVAGELKGRSHLEAMADADGDFGEAVRAAGFALPKREAGVVARQSAQTLDARFLEGSVLKPQMRKLVAGHVDLTPLEVNVQVLWKLMKSRSTASWYLARLKENGFDTGDMTAERLVTLAQLQAENTALARVEHLGADVGGGIMGIGERMTWLVFVSMLVCIVGIANAMLMSVTERFREIATLKCLGALDTSIMLMCVIEACMLGVVGGAMGAIAGALIGLGRLSVACGGFATKAVPFGQLLVVMVLSVAVGIVLAAIAALYPSFKAARLAPMEAMRVE